jgi:hypothetical protein
MKYTTLLAAALIAVCVSANAVSDETVIAVDVDNNNDEVVHFESAGEGDGNGTFPLTDEEDVVVTIDDSWEAPGHHWNSSVEDTRDGGGGATDPVLVVGEPIVENKFQGFSGKDASLSLATERGRGGGVLGHGRGEVHGSNRKRTLEALRGSRK